MRLPATVRYGRRAVALSVATAAATAVAALGASPASAVPAEGDIQSAGTDTVVANSFVVVLKPSPAAVDTSARDLASRYGGQVGHTYNNAIRGFQVSMTEAKAKELAANAAVAYVQRNGIYRISSTQANPPSWGLDRIDQRNQIVRKIGGARPDKVEVAGRKRRHQAIVHPGDVSVPGQVGDVAE